LLAGTFWNTIRTPSILISSVPGSLIFVGLKMLTSPVAAAFWETPSGCPWPPFETLQEIRSPDFPLDMLGRLCYILPVCQAFETPKASYTREAEARRGQRHAEIESYSDVPQHSCLTDDEMTDELGHQLPYIGYPG
jgi:hypothetical protein